MAKRFAAVFAVFLFLFSSGGYTYAALNKTLPAAEISPSETQVLKSQTISLPWPVTGQAAIGSVEEGVLAVSSTEEKAVPIASMTKTMTALAILHKAPLQPGEQGITYTFDANDAALYRGYLARQGSVVPVNEGQMMTQAQALEYLLIISANNLADSMVLRHFGSMEAYLVYANNLAKEYGLNDTVITDASGFAPTTVSTPSDLIKLGTRALANPMLASIVSKTTVDLPGYGQVKNSNQLLKESGVIGIKTGTTDEAGRCVLFAAHHVISEGHSVTIVGVVMGMPSSSALYDTARTLLNESKKSFGKTEVIAAGTSLGNISTPWGESSEIITSEPLNHYGWLGKTPSYISKLSDLNLPIAANQEAGRVELENAEHSSVALVTKNAVSEPTAFWRLKNYF